MKSILAALAFVATLPAQAQTEKPVASCWSTNSGTAYKVTIGQEKTMSNPFSPVEAPSKYYPVQIVELKSDLTAQTVVTFQGVGEVTDSKAQLTLLIGGDMAMGSLDIVWSFDNFAAGILKASYPGEGLKLDMACSR